MAQLEGYAASDLKELMDNIGGWAQGWDDAVWYVETVATYDADFADEEIEPLASDLRRLQEEGAEWSTDYREVYEAITGEPCAECDEPEGLTHHAIHPRKLADDYLKGLEFPAKKAAVLETARDNDAPEDMFRTLEQIEDEEYPNVGRLLEAIGDVSWDHD